MMILEHPFLVLAFVLGWHLLVWGTQLIAAKLIFWLGYLALDIKGARVFNAIGFPIYLILGVLGSWLIHVPAVLERAMEHAGLSPDTILFWLYLAVGFLFVPVCKEFAIVFHLAFIDSDDGQAPTNVAEHREKQLYQEAKRECLSTLFRWTVRFSVLGHVVAVLFLYVLLGI